MCQDLNVNTWHGPVLLYLSLLPALSSVRTTTKSSPTIPPNLLEYMTGTLRGWVYKYFISCCQSRCGKQLVCDWDVSFILCALLDVADIYMVKETLLGVRGKTSHGHWRSEKEAQYRALQKWWNLHMRKAKAHAHQFWHVTLLRMRTKAYSTDFLSSATVL